ncbi:MAG TPA: hypothetical protein VGS79_26525 [Puia sp.]|nr:hypothetical protein [Puia sp.]
MKKLIGLLLTGMFVAVGANTQAQTPTSDKAYLLNIHNIATDKAAVKATRDFWARTGDQNDAQWYKTGNGYLAEYYEGATQAHYLYDHKGNFSYSMLTYTEKEMPADVRHLVRSNYYDFTIGWVKEINESQVTAYVVHIEDAASWKDLVVQDGEIRVLHAYYKN